ncbi:MAG TPA: hypothetical protein VK694_03350 [Verrucomicrobiae bacterium]|nr:hypothetical protein [Verrucomicrobiae bacterium]
MMFHIHTPTEKRDSVIPKSVRKWTLRLMVVGVGVVAYITKPWWRGEKLDLPSRHVLDTSTRQIANERHVGFDEAQRLEATPR